MEGCLAGTPERSSSGESQGLTEVLVLPRSPWENAYAEQFVGSLRRERLDHAIALNGRSTGSSRTLPITTIVLEPI